MTSSVGSVPDFSPDYSFARRPKWLLSHVLVAALIIAMIVAGLWQIDRHRSRSELNDIIADRMLMEPVPLSSIAPPGTPASIGEAEQFRRVTVSGEYQLEDEVLIRNRTFEGAPGWWVLTPFLTDEGWAVAVNRGWISSTYDDDAPRPGTEPAAGVIEVIGTVQPARTAEGFQVADPAEGQLSSLGRPDVQRLAQQVDYQLSPVVLRLDASSVGETGEPIALALPPLNAGSHASYAAQWFIFTTIALIGYPMVLRRVSRGKAGSVPE